MLQIIEIGRVRLVNLTFTSSTTTFDRTSMLVSWEFPERRLIEPSSVARMWCTIRWSARPRLAWLWSSGEFVEEKRFACSPPENWPSSPSTLRSSLLVIRLNSTGTDRFRHDSAQWVKAFSESRVSHLVCSVFAMTLPDKHPCTV